MPPEPFDHWRGELVRLRKIEPTDWEQFQAIDRSDSEGQRNGYFIPPGQSTLDYQEWTKTEATRKFPEANDDWRWAIEVLRTGLVAGSMNVHSSDRQHGRFEYGIALGPEFRNQRYAADAVKLLCRHYFGELRYHRLSGLVYAFNAHSQHFHERFGFTLEGRVREYLFTAGRFHDVLWFGLTAEEFWAKYPEMRAGPWQA
ncbi:MAG: GNAT family N-acetyltransferase [Dehalococcoidia bacterium]